VRFPASGLYVCFSCCPRAATSACFIASTAYAFHCFLARVLPTGIFSAARLPCDSYVHLHRYLVALNELQASFTGEEQRLGMFILHHAVAKTFSIGEPKDGSESNDSDEAAGSKASAARTSRKQRAKGKNGAKTKTAAKAKVPAQRQGAHSQVVQPSGPPGAATEDVPELTFDEGGDSSEDELPPGVSFDWDSYKAVLGDTPFEDAVTAMFAEYAVLYGRIAGWTTSSTPPDLTVDEAKSLSDHAVSFIKNFVRPILGEVHTPKIHKLLTHILGAIRYHGNIRNGNTSRNEAGHKTDKRFYNRTNKAVSTFTSQIARQSQGTQTVLAKNAKIDAAVIKADKLRRARRALSRGGKLTSEGERSVHKVPRIAVGGLAQRPGLGRLTPVLGMRASDKVPVLGRVTFYAMLDCGTRLRQTLRASMDYRRKGPWLDDITYTVSGEASVPDEETGESSAPIHFREVRALSRFKEEDVAIVCNMEEVQADKDCPLGECDCTRWKWKVLAEVDGDWSVSAVPISSVRCVVHVVPDFAELTKRKSVKAPPARYSASVQDRQAMSYYENAFCPWD